MDSAVLQLRTTLLLFLPAPELAPNSPLTVHVEISPKQIRKAFSNCCKTQTGQKEIESHQSFISYANDTFIFFPDDLRNSLITLKSCAIWNAVLTFSFVRIPFRISEDGHKNCCHIFVICLYKLYPSKKNSVGFSPQVIPQSSLLSVIPVLFPILTYTFRKSFTNKTILCGSERINSAYKHTLYLLATYSWVPPSRLSGGRQSLYSTNDLR